MWRTTFDTKIFVADLVDLATDGKIAVLEEVSGAYILGRLKASRVLRQNPRPKPTADEKLVLGKLFAAADTLRLERDERARVGESLEALHSHLRWSLEKVQLLANARYLIPGILISLLTLLRCGLAIQGTQESVFLIVTIWLLPGSLACLVLGELAILSWRNALFDPFYAPAARKQAIVITGIFIPVLVGEVIGLGVMAWVASAGVVLLLLLLAAIHDVFYVLLKVAGGSVGFEIEAFRVYIAAEEQNGGTVMSPHNSSLEQFEMLLPYAIALNVEKVWGEKFATALSEAAKGGTFDYSPHGYTGPAWNPITTSTFATSLSNSFASAVSGAMRETPK